MKNFTQKFIGLLVFVFTINNAFAQCDGNDWNLHLEDSFGDGWNGATLSISNCDGAILESDIELSYGDHIVIDVCLPISDGYVIDVGGGDFDEEISWELFNEDGDVEMFGGAGGTVTNCDSGSGDDSGDSGDGSCIYWEEVANNLQSELDNVVPEDGVSQADVDAAYAEGVASVTPEDGVSQADVDAAFADGVASVEIPECEEVATQNMPLDLPQGWSMFGYTCLESLDVVEAFSGVSDNIEIVKDEWGLAYLPAWGFSAFSNLEFGEGYQIKMIEEVTDFQFCTTIAGGASQEELDAAYDAGVASVTPEDGVTQADLEAVQQQLNTANQTISELQAEGDWSNPPEDYWWYWNDVEDCLDGEALKCANAAEYLSEYNAPNIDAPWEIMECVNATMGHWDLWSASQYACPDALAYPELLAEFFGADYCTIDSDSDGVCDQEEVVGCQDESAFNFNPLATDSGNCIPKIYGCLDLYACNYNSEANTDDDSCVFPTNNLNCSGNTIQIGDYSQGGIVFQINEDGTGLVADVQDLGLMNWYSAMDAALSATSQGYDDWYLPSIDELELMYNTIGNGGPVGNIGGFETNWYWSSSENDNYWARIVSFNDGYLDNFNVKTSTDAVRVIRAF